MAKSDLIKAEAYAAMTRTMSLGREFASQLAQTDDFLRPVVVAQALNELRKAIDADSLAILRSMENTPLGFRTDRQDGYAEHVLRDCMIQAMLDGLGFAGNQWNIIAGAYYVTKEGWTQKLMRLGASGIVPFASLPDDCDVSEGTPSERGSKKYTVKMGAYAECWLAGEKFTSHMRAADGYDTRRMISAYGKDLAEAMSGIAGKAEATALKKLYYLCRGIPEPAEPEEAVSVIESEKIITLTPVEPATDEQVELYRKAVQGIEESANITMLTVADQAIAALKKSGSLTADQLSSLRSLRDVRKQAIK
jgi:hypothetical protein